MTAISIATASSAASLTPTWAGTSTLACTALDALLAVTIVLFMFAVMIGLVLIGTRR